MMTVNVYWLDDTGKDIVQYDFEGKWTWEQFYPAYEKALKMEKDQAPKRVDVILDFRRSGPVPGNVLTHIRGITDRQPDNIGLSVLVTTSQFFNIMYNAAIKFYPKTKDYFVIVKTPEDAHKIINEDRKSQAVIDSD